MEGPTWVVNVYLVNICMVMRGLGNLNFRSSEIIILLGYFTLTGEIEQLVVVSERDELWLLY